MFYDKLCFCLLTLILVHQGSSQSGPDPWNYDSKPPDSDAIQNIPPDIRMPLKRRTQTENKLGIGEWFFRRTLAIILRGGQTKRNEDGSVDISLQMKFDTKQWETLEECLKSDNALSEDMLRRTVGYVQESIYKPTIAEKIVMAWSDYVQIYLTEYKIHITWTLGFLAAACGFFWLWSNMSHRHVAIIIFIIFYGYEVVISYKEAEQKELEKFLSAVEKCKWYFWKSTCDVPTPDLLVFLKHMNPMKIGIKMCTTALAEPIVAVSGTIDIILHGVTDGLWYPFNKFTYVMLTIMINISLIYFLIMIIFNWLLNIPFHLGFGLISIGQRQRRLFSDNTTAQKPSTIQDSDRISQATLDRILNVCSLALSNNAQSIRTNITPSISRANAPSIRRSASTGRLPNLNSSYNSNSVALDNVVRIRNRPHDGSGDAL